MYKLGFILLFFGIQHFSWAQHVVKKEIDVDIKNIEIICNDIDELKLQSINKNQIWVILQDAENKLTNVDILKEEDRIVIKQKKNLPQNDIINKFCVKQPLYASYIIKVPKNSNVYLKIESGNLNIDSFKGFINADIGTGAILLNNNFGNINLKIVDGSVKAYVKNSELNLSTNLGNIESSLHNLKAAKNNKTLNGVYKNDHNKLIITAVKANIYVMSVKK